MCQVQIQFSLCLISTAVSKKNCFDRQGWFHCLLLFWVWLLHEEPLNLFLPTFFSFSTSTSHHTPPRPNFLLHLFPTPSPPPQVMDGPGKNDPDLKPPLHPRFCEAVKTDGASYTSLFTRTFQNKTFHVYRLKKKRKKSSKGSRAAQWHRGKRQGQDGGRKIGKKGSRRKRRRR